MNFSDLLNHFAGMLVGAGGDIFKVAPHLRDVYSSSSHVGINRFIKARESSLLHAIKVIAGNEKQDVSLYAAFLRALASAVSVETPLTGPKVEEIARANGIDERIAINIVDIIYAFPGMPEEYDEAELKRARDGVGEG